MRTWHGVKYLDGLLVKYIIQDFQQVCLGVKPQYQVFFVVIVQNIVIFCIVQHMVYVLAGDPMLERGRRELDNDFHASILSQNHRRGKGGERKGAWHHLAFFYFFGLFSPESRQTPNLDAWESLPNAWESLPNAWESLPNAWKSFSNVWESFPNAGEGLPNAGKSLPSVRESLSNAWEGFSNVRESRTDTRESK
jgi:hypothetical protein